MAFLTYDDALRHALDYVGGTADARSLRDAKRAVLQAYDELMRARTWSYLLVTGRIHTSAPYATGTIAVDASRDRVILSGGTWPTWAAEGGSIRIDTVSYDITARVSDTALTMSADVGVDADIDFTSHAISAATNTSPIQVTSTAHGLTTGDSVVVELPSPMGDPDLPATYAVTVLDADNFTLDGSTSGGAYTSGGIWYPAPTTAYTLYRDCYVLPEDFTLGDTPIYELNFGGLTYCHPTDVLWSKRFIRTQGVPWNYTITGDRRYPGRLVTLLFPVPDFDRTIDYVYRRRPRALRYYGEVGPGTVSLAGTATATGGSTAVVGTGTAWTSDLVGCVFRLGTTADVPTGPEGDHPAAFEGRVAAVADATHLTLTAAPTASYTAVKWAAADYVDLEAGAMTTAFLRGVELQMSIARTLKDKPNALALYNQALREAMAADSRTIQPRGMGEPASRRLPVKYMPAKFT